MVAPGTVSDILQRIAGPPGKPLPPEVARFFLDITFTDAEQQRIAELSEKANEGELSPEERDELDTFLLLNDFLIIMQSKAKASVKHQSPAA